MTVEASAARKYRLVQETTYDVGESYQLMQVIMELRVRRGTGTLLIDLSQGGVNRVRFREEQDIHYDER